MGRITNLERDAIIEAATEFAFNKRDKELKSNENKLAHELYNTVIPLKERKTAAELPEHWFRLDTCLRFNVAGMDVKLNCVGVRVPHSPKNRDQQSSYGCNRLGVIAAGPLADKVRAYLDSIEQSKTIKTQTRSKLKALLYSVTTTKKLQEIWPEGEQFYKSFLGDKPTYNLPALQLSELNAALGIAT